MKLRAFLYAAAGVAWVAVPLVAVAAGLVPVDCATNPAAKCNLCTFSELVQNIINFVIGLSIPLAAILFSYAGWLYFSNREDTSKVQQAHRIFSSVLIGFAIAVGAWLIVQTILKTLAPNYVSWNSFDCRGLNRPIDKKITDLLPNLAPPAVTVDQQAILGGAQPGPGGVSLGGLSCGDQDPDAFMVGTRCYGTIDNTQQSWDATRTYGTIADAAARFEGFVTRGIPNTDDGNKACAWAVNEIITSQGYATLGDGYTVASMRDALANQGRGEYVPTSDAQPGDIIVWKTDRVSHIGICESEGCTSAISNSSSERAFTNRSGPVFQGVVGQVYRLK